MSQPNTTPLPVVIKVTTIARDMIQLDSQHRPIRACAACGQPWPCTTELDRMAAETRTREYVTRAIQIGLAAAIARTVDAGRVPETGGGT